MIVLPATAVIAQAMLAITLSCALSSVTAGAQATATSEQTGVPRRTLARSETLQPIAATAADLHWLVGEWRGAAMGGQIEETWTAPSGGSMLGMFKLVVNDKAVFYELMSLGPDTVGVALRLKHFHADMRGWEEKDTVRRFVLLRKSETAADFDGISYSLSGDTLTSVVATRQRDGGFREETFTFVRRR